MITEPHVDETQPDQSNIQGDGQNFGATKVVPEPSTEGNDADSEDKDIRGKAQEDLTAEDLEGDARSKDVD